MAYPTISRSLRDVLLVAVVGSLALAASPADAKVKPKSPTAKSAPAIGAAYSPYTPLGIAPEPNVAAQTLVAAARGKAVRVYESAGAPTPRWTLNNSTNFSGRHVFVVLAQQGEWLKVSVPVRPNGTVGFVRAADVAVGSLDFAIVVSLGDHRLTLYKAGNAVLQEKVGVGKTGTPTPVGSFFLRELARTANPRGSYGPYAFGLSAYSNVLQRFGRGDGQIGLHGTNQPGLLGTDVSHGCLRISNSAITRLALTLPQGVPIDIRP